MKLSDEQINDFIAHTNCFEVQIAYGSGGIFGEHCRMIASELIAARKVIEAVRSKIATYPLWLSEEEKQEPTYVALMAYDALDGKP